MGISPIIYDPALLGFPDFPTGNLTVFSTPTTGTNFTVPTGVQWIGAKIWGAGGGGTSLSSGGAGSFTQILIEVYVGEILQVRIGGGGTRGTGNSIGGGTGTGGINGGGNGGIGFGGGAITGGGGGGYSGIFINNRPLVIVGGGGGAGSSGGGSGSSSGTGIVAEINSYQASNGLDASNVGNGGGGGGFYSGSGGKKVSPNTGDGGGSGLSCAVLRDYMVNLIARRTKVFFIFSNQSTSSSGYLGYGNGGSSTNGSDGRIEITY